LPYLCGVLRTGRYRSVMKKTHIIILVLMAVAAGVIIAMSADFTTYSDFPQAQAKPNTTVKVVGYLAKDKEIIYDPQKDANYFSFTMTDKQGNPQQVWYKGSKPQDFERSEQVVITGRMDGQMFHASEILLKCPSKYVNDQIVLKEKQTS
jgi:cytochrome c-type biogenesis protein CcmE